MELERKAQSKAAMHTMAVVDTAAEAGSEKAEEERREACHSQRGDWLRHMQAPEHEKAQLAGGHTQHTAASHSHKAAADHKVLEAVTAVLHIRRRCCLSKHTSLRQHSRDSQQAIHRQAADHTAALEAEASTGAAAMLPGTSTSLRRTRRHLVWWKARRAS